jgi:CrcB protein
MSYLLLAIGDGLGTVFRFSAGQQVPFPFGTISVNIIGFFIMGLAFVYTAGRYEGRTMLFVMTGVIMGGFTTFSAFSLDTLKLWEAGKPLFELGYVTASVVASLVALT